MNFLDRMQVWKTIVSAENQRKFIFFLDSYF